MGRPPWRGVAGAGRPAEVQGLTVLSLQAACGAGWARLQHPVNTAQVLCGGQLCPIPKLDLFLLSYTDLSSQGWGLILDSLLPIQLLVPKGHLGLSNEPMPQPKRRDK